jgi:hypothetical protein
MAEILARIKALCKDPTQSKLYKILYATERTVSHLHQKITFMKFEWFNRLIDKLL